MGSLLKPFRALGAASWRLLRRNEFLGVDVAPVVRQAGRAAFPVHERTFYANYWLQFQLNEFAICSLDGYEPIPHIECNAEL